MITIKNIDKMVGTKIVLHNFNVPSPLLEWECEKVIEFPDDTLLGAVGRAADESYRFEYKAVSDYDVPLCIYLRRTPNENGIYQMENNLMDGDDWLKITQIQDMRIFQKNLEMYATEVIMRWAKDQNML
jgi:hypothetical protein